MIDENNIKKDFPLFNRHINGKPIIYLDSAATSLKPQMVINAMQEYYTGYSANVFRGIYTISEEATARYEEAREKIASFIHGSADEIVFTRNTTESLNLLAYTLIPQIIGPGDTVVTTIMEHHSNFVPWQQLLPTYHGELKVLMVTSDGTIDVDGIERVVTKRTKIFTCTAVSNVLGTINPISDIVKTVKRISPACLVIVDGAQAVPHMAVDVGEWGADAIAFSGHKMLGPSGIGCLWVRKELLTSMQPFLYGGDMIREVHLTNTEFNDVPHKFEAGTPFIEGAIGLGAAVSYLENIGMDDIRHHEELLVTYAYKQMHGIPGLTVYGPTDPKKHAGVMAFNLEGIHPHDVAQVLDEENICIRVGFHCAMPLHESLHIGSSCRASFYLYTKKEDIDALVTGIQHVKKVFS